MNKFIRKNLLLFLFLTVIIFLSLSVSRISPAPPQTHFVDQAYAFLNGQLNLVSPIRLFDDYALFQNKAYLYFSPLPVIVLIPFVFLFGLSFPQEILMPFITGLNFFLIYKICRRFGLKNERDCLWLAAFFIFGTIYLFLSLTTISAYYTQIFGVTFLLLAIHEFLTKKRFFLIGVYLALATLSRQTLLLSIVFFALEILGQEGMYKPKIKKISLLLLPMVLIFMLYSFYNYARFNNYFETGYSYQTNKNPIYLKARKEGTFSLKHLPGNIYFLFFKGPDPIRADSISYVLKPPYLRVNEWGMGIFFTSPLFLYLLLLRLKARYITSSLITTILIAAPNLLYFGIGLWQYGYRYALDFYPFLFLMLLSVFKEQLPLRAKLLILFSIVFNLLFMYSIWYKYPFNF